MSSTPSPVHSRKGTDKVTTLKRSVLGAGLVCLAIIASATGSLDVAAKPHRFRSAGRKLVAQRMFPDVGEPRHPLPVGPRAALLQQPGGERTLVVGRVVRIEEPLL